MSLNTLPISMSSSPCKKSPRAMKDVLSQIISLSRDLITSSSVSINYRPSFPRKEVPIPNCIFPQPKPLRLDPNLGLDGETVEKLAILYMRAARHLKARCEDHIRRASYSFIQSASPLQTDDSTRLRSLHATNVSWYTDRLDALAEVIKVRALRAKQRGSNAVVHSRRSFSQHVVSILEKFFEKNAFPSRLEKHDLAVEAQLKYEQVHVWFQNRRRRFRQEGKELKKGESTVRFPLELDTSVAELLAVAEPGVYGTSDAPLKVEAPPHAFPSMYPPACPYDPFPIGKDAPKFNTPWIRNPSSIFPRRHSDIDVAHLTVLFKDMNLFDEPRRDASRILSQRRLPSHCSSATVMSCAPHPALISTVVTSPTSAVPSTLPESHGSSVPFIQYTASFSQEKKTSSRRKVAPLPKRIPTSAVVVHPVVSQFCTPSSSPSSRSPQRRRKVAALPNRASVRSTVISNIPPFPPFVSTSFRTSSGSSSMSSESSSSSGTDTPLSTPPFFSISLPPSKIATLCALEHAWSFNFLSSEPSIDESSSTKGLQLQLEPMVQTNYSSS